MLWRHEGENVFVVACWPARALQAGIEPLLRCRHKGAVQHSISHHSGKVAFVNIGYPPGEFAQTKPEHEHANAQ